MKKIVSFFILLITFIVILMQPTVEIPAAASHSVSVWPILCYLTAVAAAAGIVAWENREKKEKQSIAEPEMA